MYSKGTYDADILGVGFAEKGGNMNSPICKLILSVLLLASAGLAKTKDPAVEQRKEFVNRYTQTLEREGWPPAGVMLAGKEKDVLQIWFHNAAVERIYVFEKQYVEPLRQGEGKAKMKALGFKTVEIKTDVFSASFPKGVWDIPLD